MQTVLLTYGTDFCRSIVEMHGNYQVKRLKNSQCFIQSRWYLQTGGSKRHENCLEPLELETMAGLETMALGQAQPTACVARPVSEGWCFFNG